jgi:indolepyruvate ferredoxin oxidoreductase beta subunit
MTTKALMKDPLSLIITGVGGQGNVLISQLIGNALVNEGYLVTIGETYGASQRGGAVMSHVRVSKVTQCSPLIPEGRADVILGMEPVETMRVLAGFGNPNVITIFNPRPVYTMGSGGGAVEYPDLDNLIEKIKELSAKTWIVRATEEAQKMGRPILANMILIGGLIGAGVLPLDRKAMEPEIRERFPTAYEANMMAFNRGMELVRQ